MMKKYKELEQGFAEYAERVEMVMNKFDDAALEDLENKIMIDILKNEGEVMLNQVNQKKDLLTQHHRLWRKDS